MNKTYFYQKIDGRIFACEAKEANNIHSKYQQVGVSDGTAYQTEIDKARDDNAELFEEMSELKAELGQLEPEDIESRLVVRKALRPVEKKWKKIMAEAVKRGWEAELEVAKGNLETPPDFHKMEIGGDNNKLNINYGQQNTPHPSGSEPQHNREVQRPTGGGKGHLGGGEGAATAYEQRKLQAGGAIREVKEVLQPQDKGGKPGN